MKKIDQKIQRELILILMMALVFLLEYALGIFN